MNQNEVESRTSLEDSSTNSVLKVSEKETEETKPEVESDEKSENFKVPPLPSHVQAKLIGTKPSRSNGDDSQCVKKNDLDQGKESQRSVEKDKDNSLSILSLEALKKRALSKMSPAELLREQNVSCVTYREPLWSGMLENEYWIEVIKNGIVLEQFSLDKPMASIGRSKHVDVVLEHPSISRLHAVFQMRPTPGLNSGDEQVGLYLYDTGSTHGTFVNKCRIEPNCYNRVKVGHVIKFGSSTRLFILHGPQSDAPTESPYTITEIKAMNAEIKRRQLEAIEEKKRRAEMESNEGINWGMKEDAVEEDDDEVDEDSDDDNVDLSRNPYASSVEELNLEDPKKTLKGCFEREGFELEFICEEQDGFGTHLCRIELPMIDTDDGKPVFAEVLNKGKRRDIQIQCALEACRILDAHGILRSSTHEGRSSVKKRNWAENDYYDSDDDSYLDRTGAVETKRLKRMERFAGSSNDQQNKQQTVHTFESLSADLLSAQEELSKLEQRIQASHAYVSKMTSLDTLDEYMQGMKSGQELDATTRRKLKMRTIELKKDIARIEKMREAARPVEVKLKNNWAQDSKESREKEILKNKLWAHSKFASFALKKKNQGSGSDADTGGSKVENENSQMLTGIGGEKTNPLLETTVLNSESKSVSQNRFGANVDVVVKKSADGTEYEEEEEVLGNEESIAGSIDKETPSNREETTSKLFKDKKSEDCNTKNSTVVGNSSPSAASVLSKIAAQEFKPSKNTCAEVAANLSSKTNVSSCVSQQKKSNDCPSSQGPRPKTGFEDKVTLSNVPADVDEGGGFNDQQEGDAFSGWIPPSNQKGDGKTKLNDLLGY